MHLKRIFALALIAVLFLCGCADSRLVWNGNVAVVSDDYLSEEEFAAFYDTVREFDTIMPETICDMLCIEGQLGDESALLAFVRYKVILASFPEAKKEDAQALLKELGLPEDEKSLDCAVIYCTISFARTQSAGNVQVTDEEVKDFYQDQVRTQMEIANDDIVKAQENYMLGAYDVTVYVPEGLKFVQAMAITTQERESGEAFSIAQKVWRNLLYNESFEDLFAEYNEVSAYANKDGTPKTFCIYDAWQEDPAIVLLCENLDKPGQMCGPTMYEGVCYIMRYVSAPTSGSIAFELVEDQCREGALAQKQQDIWADVLDTMQHDLQVRFAPYN